MLGAGEDEVLRDSKMEKKKKSVHQRASQQGSVSITACVFEESVQPFLRNGPQTPGTRLAFSRGTSLSCHCLKFTNWFLLIKTNYKKAEGS